MPLFVTVTPGTTISNTTTLDPTTLNLLGTPSVDVTGTVDGGSLSLSAGSVGNAELAAHAVTFDKMQQIGTDKLIGRDAASTGDATEIGVGGGLEFSGSNSIQIQSGTSTSTGVTYSKIQHVSATNKLLGRKSSGAGTVEEIGLGSGLTISGGNLATTKQVTTYSNGTLIAIPAAGNAITPVLHTLGTTPDLFRVYLWCDDAGGDCGYAMNDIVPVELVQGNSDVMAFTPWASASQIGVIRTNQSLLYINRKDTGARVDYLNASKWKIYIFAVRFT